jgi:hypothetical protein
VFGSLASQKRRGGEKEKRGLAKQIASPFPLFSFSPLRGLAENSKAADEAKT